jgi:hypothetical protein
MAISDDFKEKLKAGQIIDALTLALGEAVELEITTWVSSDTETSSETDLPSANSRMRTRINIVDGDIDNEIGSQFIGNGPYTELRQFHMEQVLEGRKIIQNNLENIQQLFTVLTNTLDRLPSNSRRSEQEYSVLPPPTKDNLP